MATRKGKRVAIVAGALALVVLSVAVVLGWKHLVFYYRFEPLGKNAQGYREFKHRQTGIVMVKLPGGAFEMGSPEGEAGSEPNEHPRHRVTLSPFLMAKTELSQEVWTRFMGKTSSFDFPGPDLPAQAISWSECEECCRKTGLAFPTEAQWEYTCRAGTTTAYHFGDSITAAQAVFGDTDIFNRVKKPVPTRSVNSMESNTFGLHHMHGNIFEWCADWYDDRFYTSSDAVARDPINTIPSEFKVFRGGSYKGGADICRSAYRGFNGPKGGFHFIGFRPATPAP